MTKNPQVSRIDLEPLGGIAGDMFAAALFNGFPFLYEYFCEDLRALEVDGLSATLEDRLSNSLQASYFDVVQDTSQKPPRTLDAVREFFNLTSLPESVAIQAVGIFTLLARAEAQVHGKSIQTVHFHEVSDWDSMVDIVAAAGIIARLNCPLWRVGVLPLGGGSVNTAHGDIPVPAPATLALLHGFQWQDDGILGERVTPTGAAILAYLGATPVGVAAPAANLIASGSGCGTRELDGKANLLRMVAFSKTCDQAGVLHDEVVRIEFEVDDMTAEELAWAADELRATDGVHDIASVAMQGKKNRLATGLRVIAATDQLNSVIKRCFSVTSTIGIRYGTVQRFVLDRTEEGVDEVSVKVVSRPAGDLSAKTSSDDLSACASLTKRRQLGHFHSEAALQRQIATDVEKIK